MKYETIRSKLLRVQPVWPSFSSKFLFAWLTALYQFHPFESKRISVCVDSLQPPFQTYWPFEWYLITANVVEWYLKAANVSDYVTYPCLSTRLSVGKLSVTAFPVDPLLNTSSHDHMCLQVSHNVVTNRCHSWMFMYTSLVRHYR